MGEGVVNCLAGMKVAVLLLAFCDTLAGILGALSSPVRMKVWVLFLPVLVWMWVVSVFFFNLYVYLE